VIINPPPTLKARHFDDATLLVVKETRGG
jgi:hypothetical protein